MITLRGGGDAAENAARRFHHTSAVELIGYANRRANIEKMPVRYITYPGSADQQLFESAFFRVRATGRPIVLSRQYLAQSGRFRAIVKGFDMGSTGNDFGHCEVPSEHSRRDDRGVYWWFGAIGGRKMYADVATVGCGQ